MFTLADGTLVTSASDLTTASKCEFAFARRVDGEDLTGHEVRARSNGADRWGAWGVAYRRNSYGNWVTKGGAVLTGGWTYETTAPLPEPEPWDEALVGVVSDALAGAEGPAHHWADDARRVLDALAARGYLDRAAITGGE